MKWNICGYRAAFVISLVVVNSTYAYGYAGWTTERKLHARELTRALWNHGFDSYMHNAFPLDELKPISCKGRGPDWTDPTVISFNDVLANCSITLIDNLDSFIILNNRTGFQHAVWNTIAYVSFDVDTKPQVFETTIRVLGGLLSAHIFSVESTYGFALPGYNNELLELAYDLGERLLPAFNTPTGIPYARVNLRKGVQNGESNETCSAGAGSLLLEFTTLSRLTGDPRFEDVAIKAFFAIWNRRSELGLIGNTIDLLSGRWLYPGNSGVGSGIDSFYEYALKMYVLTGEDRYLDVWSNSYEAIMKHSRGLDSFWYRSISMHTGELTASWIDSLGAFWPGLQVLSGDVESAVKSHLVYWNLWKRFSGMPETFDIMTREGVTMGYPLRPEFIESTYFLYRATRDSFYLDVGARILTDLTRRTKVACGLASIANLLTGIHEDRMETFALSESLKYLYLLFDEDNVFNRDLRNFIFTTEGHMLFLNHSYVRQSPSIDRALPHSSSLTCPAYSPRVALSQHDISGSGSQLEPVQGLVGSVRQRADFEYARVLAGIAVSPDSYDKLSWTKTRPKSLAVVTEEDKTWWDERGWCEVPEVEEYVLEWVLSSDGHLVPEDRVPGPDKIRKVIDGYEILNITGIRTQVTARIDRTGYDVTQIGPYRVLSSQKVYINDPLTIAAVRGDIPQKSNKRTTNPPDAVLSFSFAPSSGSNPRFDNSPQAPFSVPNFRAHYHPRFNESFVFDALAGTAGFGGNPILPPEPPQETGSEHDEGLPPFPLVFSADSPHNGAIRVVRSTPDNAYGCDDYPPNFLSGILPSCSFSETEEKVIPSSSPNLTSTTSQSSPSPSPSPPSSHLAPAVLFVRRGECTFLRKVITAKRAHFAGVIVWNLEGTQGASKLINPTIDKGDQEWTRREVWDVSIVVVGKEDGEVMEEMLDILEGGDGEEGNEWGLVVEVKRAGVLDEKGSRGELPAQLYINGFALRNTILVP